MSISTFVIDDAPVMIGVLERMFAETDIEVVGSAISLSEGEGEIEKLKPDIILFDVDNEADDINESLDRLLDISPDSKIILCAGTHIKDSLMPSINSGATDFITKPYKKPIVIRTVKKAMGIV